jgi:hypothetical protein
MVAMSTLVELNAGVTIQLLKDNEMRATARIKYSDDFYSVMLSSPLWHKHGHKVVCVGYDESGYIIIHKENAPRGLVEYCSVLDLVNVDPNGMVVEEERVLAVA